MQIAICGCGITGLAAALLLKRTGHGVQIFEQAATPSPSGSGLMLQPPGMMVLQQLGLLEKALIAGQPIRRLLGTNRKLRTVLDIQYESWAPGWYGLGIHRGVLWGLLYDAARSEGVPIHAATPIIRLQTMSGAAFGRTTLVDATGTLQGEFDLVLGADGSRSALRRAHVADASVEYPWGALWASLDKPAEWDAAILSQRYHQARQMMGVLPVGRDARGRGPGVTMFWSAPANLLDEVRRDPNVWRKNALELWPEARPVIEQITSSEQLIPARYFDVRPKDWIGANNKLLLIGDAAHGTSPQLGQGATLGLLDALILTAYLQQNGLPEEKLRRYVNARRKHVHYYQWASRMLTPWFQSERDWLARLRDATLGLTCRLPIAGGEFCATLVGAKTGALFGRLPSELRAPANFPNAPLPATLKK